MDLQTALVCLAVFLISAIVVYLISVLGMRETTYEEAIAQQRRKDEETLQLKKSDKTSSKVDKKHKKWGRKSKEKSEGKGEENSGDDLHVGFKAEAEIIPELIEEERERRASASIVSRGSKKDDPKSILINKKQKEKSPSVSREEAKEESPGAKNVVKPVAEPAAVVSAPAAQSQAQLVKKAVGPNKDVKKESPTEVHSKEGSPVVPVAEAPVVVPASDNKGGRKSRESSNEKEDEDGGKISKKPAKVAAKREDLVAVQSADNSVAPSPVKKAKKPKADEEILTCNRLSNIIKSSVLSPNEITSLIETLLNKQQAESGNEEWLKIGQKVDPITALRKQLQEKEEALAEEKLRSQTAGAKVKELRQEVNGEKSRVAQMERNLKDRHQQELQTTHAHLQKANNDVITLKNQLQQIQSKLNEEHLITQQHVEERNQLQQALNHSENNNDSLRREVEELRTLLHDRQNHILSTSDNNEKLINDNKQLQERVHQLELAQQEEESVFKARTSELTEQLMVLDEEKAYLGKLLDENREVHENLTQTVAEMNMAGSENQETQNRLLSAIEELKQEKSNLEKQFANSQITCNQLNADLHKTKDEIVALKEENELLAVQLSKVSEREEAEGQEGGGDASLHDKSNGHIQITEGEEVTKIPLTEHENILHEKEKILDRLTSELNEKNSELHDIYNQLKAAKEEVTGLALDATLQKQKNNELREKNWKVVEALNAAEKSTNDKIRQADKLAHERLHDVQKGEQKFAQEILERLFPDIRIEKSIAYPEWMSQFEKQALQTIENLSKVTEPSLDDELRNKYNTLEESYNKLQSTVQNYKVILAETEGMLNKLQGSVEEEEQRWKEKLELKEVELQKLVEERRSFENSLEQVQAAEKAAAEMQEKLKELHEKLQAEENERRLLERYKLDAENSASHFHEQLNEAEEQLQKFKLELESNSDSAKELEELKAEIERLKQQLKESGSLTAKLSGQLKIGQDALREEQDRVHQLEEELNLFRNDSKQTNATNGQTSDNCDGPTQFESRCKGETEIPSLVVTTTSPLSCISQAAPTSDPNSSTSELIGSKKSKSKKRGVLGKK